MEDLIEDKSQKKHYAVRTALIDDIISDASSERSSRVGLEPTEKPRVAPKLKAKVKPQPAVKPLERKKLVIKPKRTRRVKSAVLNEPPHTDNPLIQLGRKFHTLATADRHRRHHVMKTELESSTLNDASFNILCDVTKYDKSAVSETKTGAKQNNIAPSIINDPLAQCLVQSLQKAINEESKPEEGAKLLPVKPKPEGPRKPLKSSSATAVRSFALSDDNGECCDIREEFAIKSLPAILEGVPLQDSSSAVVNFDFSPTIKDQLDSIEEGPPHREQAISREFPDEQPSPGGTEKAKESHERTLFSMMFEEAYCTAETLKRQSYREMLLSSCSESSMTCNPSSGSYTTSIMSDSILLCEENDKQTLLV